MRCGPAHLFFFLLLLTVLTITPAEPIAEIGGQAVPGGYITARLPVEGYTSVAILGETGEIISQNVVFDRWYALVGIPPTLEPGSFRIAAIAGDGVQSVVGEVLVSERLFALEDIPLDQPMSELRTTKDLRRLEESRARWTVLSTQNTESIFATGRFVQALENEIVTSGFGDRRTFRYSDGGTEESIHTGIDLAAIIGTPVYASGTGRVVMVADRLITGNTVIIEHLPGTYSLYYHLDETAVEEGAIVRAGEIIGTVGDTGLVTGPHLHWEFRINRVPVDPDLMMGYVPANTGDGRNTESANP